jgi:pimeloyl-ACP methyl ester carboxylesterase
MSPVPIGEPERIESPAGGTFMSSAVWGAPGAAPVLLLHGMPTNALLWRRIGPTLSAEGYRVFAPDLLGFGKSGDPPSQKFGIADQARYVHQFVSGIGLRDYVIVGHDIGGGIAQHLAVSYPELTLGLVLVNTVTERNWPPLLMRILGTRPFSLVGAVVDRMVGFESVLGWGIRSAMRHAAHCTPHVLEAYASTLASRGGSSYIARVARDLTAKDTIGLTPKVASAGVPALVIWGEDDPYLDLQSGIRLADALGASLEQLSDCGHFVPEECPFELAQSMLPFLAARRPVYKERAHVRMKRTTGEFRKTDRALLPPREG